MAEGRGRARGYTPSQPAEQRQPEQPGMRRATDFGHTGISSGNGNGNGNGDRPAGGRASHRGGAQGEAVPGEGGRQSRRVPRGRRAVQEDEATVTYRGEAKDKHAQHKDAQPVTLYANYVRFSNPKMAIYQYRVEFSPEFDNRRGRTDIIRSLLPNKPYRYDGRELLFATAPLNGEAPMHFNAPHPSGSGELEITITQTNRFSNLDPQTLQFLNVAFGNDMRAIGMKRIQRHHFFVGEKQAAQVQGRDARLEVLPGFATAYSERDGGILLNIDMVSKVLRAETVAETLRSAMSRGGQSDATRAVVGQVVYAKYSNQTYRIEDVDWVQNPKSTFDKGGQKISYMDYFKQRWNYTIREADQPLLVAKPRRIPGQRSAPGAPERVNLIPELVYLTGLTEEMRRDFTLTRSMAQSTNAGPQARYDRIMDLFREMSRCNEVQSAWKRFGFEFERDLISVRGQVMPGEEIEFGGGKKVSYDAPDNPDWSRGMRDARLIAGVKLERWIVIYPQRLENDVRQFVELLQRMGRQLGMEIREPLVESVPNDSAGTYANALQRILHGKTGPGGCQLVLCVMMSSKKDTYDAIKKHCCLMNPVPSQVVLGKTIGDQRKVMSVATKVAIQINAKLGGEQWSAYFYKLKAMIVGVDVYHDTTKREQSHVGMVSSINHAYTRYYSQTQPQIAGQEHAGAIEAMMCKAINSYRAFTGELPSRIFYYRDGVSDGQLGTIVSDELAHIDNAFMRFGEDYKPAICVVVVKKRINSRFLLQSGGLRNPPPGTVIDTEVTKPNWCDFYLVSQSSRQGTVAPTHYHVVRNTGNFPVDRIQKMTYKLTHLYYNWNGTIRVPAPCQYAHKLAFITGESLHDMAHNSLAEKLWFL